MKLLNLFFIIFYATCQTRAETNLILQGFSFEKDTIYFEIQDSCECAAGTQDCKPGILRFLELDNVNSSLQDTCWQAGPSEARMEAQTHCSSALHLSCPSNSSGLFTGALYDQKQTCQPGLDWSRQVTVPIGASSKACCEHCPIKQQRWKTWTDDSRATWHRFALGYNTDFVRWVYVLPFHEMHFEQPIDVKQGLGLSIMKLQISVVILDTRENFGVMNKNNSFWTIVEECANPEEIKFTFEWNGSGLQPISLIPSHVNFTLHSCSGSNNSSQSLCLVSSCQKSTIWITEIGINQPFSIQLEFASGTSMKLEWALVTDIMPWQQYDYTPPVIMMSMAIGLVGLVICYEHAQEYCERKKQHQLVTQDDSEDQSRLTDEEIEMIIQEEVNRELQ